MKPSRTVILLKNPCMMFLQAAIARQLVWQGVDVEVRYAMKAVGTIDGKHVSIIRLAYERDNGHDRWGMRALS